MSEAVGKHSVHWFRKGLRLHDNPALLEGLRQATTFRCVFIIDPWFAGSSNVGINKWRFLLECLEDLDRSLQKLNSRLFVIRGQPADALPKLFKEWGTTSLTFEEDPEPFGRVRDHNISAMCQEIGISVVSRVSHTLYKLDKIIERNGGRAPLTYQQFQAVIADMAPPEGAEAALTAAGLDGATTPLDEDHDDVYGVPSLEELGFDTVGLKPAAWAGGEAEALARLERHLQRKAWVASYGRPKMTPQSLLASPTGLSPYLRFGCLSTRLFYYELSELYKRLKKARPPLSLHGQLLWREFFYCAATRNPHFDRMAGNPICVQIPWDRNSEALAKWANGQTGYPWIDAIMTQLREEGWIHHLARHAVACFLTRGDLWLSWEEGMKVFEELLLDADWSVNAGTWMWLSCSSFFQQFFHCYCPVRFGRKADSNGDYIRKYLPVLKSFPEQYIHAPWLAPIEVQEAAGCVIGRDYPLPMVDHTIASRANLQRIRQVYSQLSEYQPISNDRSSKEIMAETVVNPYNLPLSSPSSNTLIKNANHSNYLCRTNNRNNLETFNEQQEDNQKVLENTSDYTESTCNYNHSTENYVINKPDEDYEDCHKTVSDLFQEKRDTPASGLQVRNVPFKKIVIVGQNFNEMQHDKSIDNGYKYEHTYQDSLKQTSVENMRYQCTNGQGYENNDQESYNNMRNLMVSRNPQYADESVVKCEETDFYNKPLMKNTAQFCAAATGYFKLPDSVYDRRKTYCTKSQFVKASGYDRHSGSRRKSDTDTLLMYQEENSYAIKSEEYENFQGNNSFGYRSQSFDGGKVQSYERQCGFQYRDPMNESSNSDEGIGPGSKVLHYSHREEQARFQQGETIIMQGCSQSQEGNI